MYADLRDKGLEVVGVTKYYAFYGNERNLTPDQEFAKFADHVKEFKLTFPTVFGPNSNFEAYGVGGIPHYVLIGRDGTVKAYSIGYSPDLHAGFRKQVEAALSAGK